MITVKIYDIGGSILHVICPSNFRNSHPEVFLGEGVLKMCGKFKGEHPC